MVIKRKIDRVIELGAPVKSDSTGKKRVQVNVWIPQDLLENVNEALKDRVGISRTGWILEAIHEKLMNKL